MEAVNIGTLDQESLRKALEEALSVNKALAAKLEQSHKKLPKVPGSDDLTYKVTEKGGLSIYGLGRFPVTLYKSQWQALLKCAQAILSLLETLPGLAEKKAA